MSRDRRIIHWAAIGALATCALCSCRSPFPSPALLARSGPPPAIATDDGSQPSEVVPVGYHAPLHSAGRLRDPGCRDCQQGAPHAACCPAPLACASTVCGTSQCACGHSPGECICDGGDRMLGVRVAPDWRLYGLDAEDTVAHFDTLDGRTLVTPSNRVCVYAPRFGAVRVVTGLVQNEQLDLVAGFNAPYRAVVGEQQQVAASSLQRLQAGRHEGAVLPEAFDRRQQGGLLIRPLVPAGFHDGYLPYESQKFCQLGLFDGAEKARLATSITNAVVWTADAALQVVVDGKQARALEQVQKAQATFSVDDLREPQLRVVKMASTDGGHPGDVIDFTIRFDNVGRAPLGNIVLVDHLSPRLDYVPDSAQSSVPANFLTDRGSAGTLILRWEFSEPLEAGQGGLVRFQCRLR